MGEGLVIPFVANWLGDSVMAEFPLKEPRSLIGVGKKDITFSMIEVR